MRIILDHMPRAVLDFGYVAAPVYKDVRAYLAKSDDRAIDTHSMTSGQFLPYIRVRIPDPPPFLLKSLIPRKKSLRSIIATNPLNTFKFLPWLSYFSGCFTAMQLYTGRELDRSISPCQGIPLMFPKESGRCLIIEMLPW